MPNLTLSLPSDIYAIIKAHREIRWSEVARRAISDYATKLALLDELAAKSSLTERDIDELDHDVKAGILKHYLEKLNRQT